MLAALLFVRGLDLPRPVVFLVFAYVAIQAVSTLLNRPAWGRGFKLDALLAVEAVLAVLAASLVAKMDTRTVARTIVGAGAFTALTAVLLTVLNRVDLIGFGVQVDPVTGVCKTYGTMWEANLLGSYMAATLVFSVAAERLITPAWLRISQGLMLVALALALSRMVWLATGVGVILVLIFYWRSLDVRRALIALGLIVLLAAAALFALYAAEQNRCGLGRSSNFSRQGSINGRLMTNAMALAEWAASPIVGLGTGSTRAHIPGDLSQPWIATEGIAVLHDTGVIGAVLLAGLTVLLVWALVRGRAKASEEHRQVQYGLAAAILVLLIAFQATTGTLMEYPWLFVGTALGTLGGRRVEKAAIAA